jgi:hypothetical protein
MSSRVVDHEHHYVKVKGSSAAAATGTGREKMVVCLWHSKIARYMPA